MRICTQCRFEKDPLCFSKKRNGLSPKCKDCASKYIKAWYLANRIKVLSVNKTYRQANADNITKYRRNRRHIDDNYRLLHNLRVRLRKTLKVQNAHKSAAMSELLGCSVNELVIHIKAKFQAGMTWENHGVWHIDHIKSLSSFDLTDSAQQRAACHYSNLQPLWWYDNLSKGSH